MFYMNNLRKIIDDGHHISINLFTYLEYVDITPKYKISMKLTEIQQSYPLFINDSGSLLFIDDTIKDHYMKIFLSTIKPTFINSLGWSQGIHIDKINNFLKLKCFI